jgi:thiosulfate/3-mercaptopyruvate sulfurtransferase
VVAKGYPADGLLVDAGWVAARVNDPAVRLVDLSPWRRYQQGHLPGAAHLWWQDLMETNNDVYGMLVGAPYRATLLGQLGIERGTTVVAYDDEGGVWAARLVWLLDFVGHERVHLLDGGTQAWLAAGQALTTSVPTITPVRYEEMIRPDRIIEPEDLARLTAGGGALVDGRTAAEAAETWQGQLRIGRVPGATSVPWPENLTGPAGSFVPAADLRQHYASVLQRGQPVAVYGLFGAGSALPYVALRALGHEAVLLYDGAWAEWGATRRDGQPNELPIAPLE